MNEYLYKVGDEISNSFSTIIILKQIKIKNGTTTRKGYEYKCAKDGNIDTISETNLKNGVGCNVCTNKKTVTGINDIFTTRKDLVSYFCNLEDSKKYTPCSNKIVKLKCPICNTEKSMKVTTLNAYGFSCPKCGDGKSYGEKFFQNLLIQLKVKFKSEKKFEWSFNKRYDFYLESLNSIVEINGVQHYSQSNTFKSRTIEEEQTNDKFKKEIAIENGIDNYIVIDCRQSTLEFIKESILNSKLKKILNLDDIDWNKCEKESKGSLFHSTIELWNMNIYSPKDISKILKISHSTILRYLNDGTKLGICKFIGKDSRREILKKNRGNYSRKFKPETIIKMKQRYSKKVICLNNNKIYNSIADANKETGANHISECCNGLKKSTGVDKITGEKLKWKFYN